jgi:hypothetical protein
MCQKEKYPNVMPNQIGKRSKKNAELIGEMEEAETLSKL